MNLTTKQIAIAAVIVLYYPNFELLDRLMSGLAKQVDVAIVVDNTPIPLDGIEAFVGNYSLPSLYEPLRRNTGIAFAQNVGIRRAMKAGVSHVLLLDQDSAIPPRMVSELLATEAEALHSGAKVAAIGPVFLEEKTGLREPAVRHTLLGVRRTQHSDMPAERPFETDYLIASGSLIRRTALDAVGLMREELFIDFVDIEWGLRARSYGYKCYMSPAAIMEHSVGDVSAKIFGRNFNLHSDIRHYYLVRNASYLLRLRTMGWCWRVLTVSRIPHYILAFTWMSKTKKKTFQLLCGALVDGFRSKMGQRC